MAARKTRGARDTDEGTTDVPETVKPKPSQISHVAIVGGAPDMPEGSGVVDYLLAYMGRRVSFYNPLTGETDEREAAEVIALQMVIGALHGDKSAINRLIERTEGKVGVGVARAKAADPADANDPRNIAMQAERARQDSVREREESVAAIGRIMSPPPQVTPNAIRYEMPPQPLQIFPTPRTGDETIM